MADRADDLYLPNAVLLRIIRESLPERTIVSREARSAISKSASSFILYVTSLASLHCEAGKRKTLTSNDVMSALKEMQFDHYLPDLTTFLEKYRRRISMKKMSSAPATDVVVVADDDDVDNVNTLTVYDTDLVSKSESAIDELGNQVESKENDDDNECIDVVE